ncbi:MAG: hypothetical protein WBW73_17310 [Rhodoplanes sp.]
MSGFFWSASIINQGDVLSDLDVAMSRRVPSPSRSIQSIAPARAMIANSNRWLYGKIRSLLTNPN